VASPTYELRPIGTVRSSNGAFRIELDEPFRPALEGLAGFGHAVVVFWCHLVDNDEMRQAVISKRPYTKGPETLGIFATRSPVRPNPVGITPVQLTVIGVEQGIIEVPFIDAEDGTPVLDIKPYQPSIDRIRDVRMPDWCSHWPAWLEDSGSFDWEAELNFS